MGAGSGAVCRKLVYSISGVECQALRHRPLKPRRRALLFCSCATTILQSFTGASEDSVGAALLQVWKHNIQPSSRGPQITGIPSNDLLLQTRQQRRTVLRTATYLHLPRHFCKLCGCSCTNPLLTRRLQQIVISVPCISSCHLPSRESSRKSRCCSSADRLH